MADQQISLVDHTDDEPSSPSPNVTQSPTSNNNLSFIPQSHIDILYENQRGWFIFGIPLFSSKALWNLKLDQAPWVDASFRPSAVDITNAQVPDPSWVWDMKTWYVDMSRDVDEEGWEYSFWFRGRGPRRWHGNHPWWHSFVRRRRWVRRRVKRNLPGAKYKERERLFGETFSVGTTILRTSTLGGHDVDSGAEGSVEEEIRDIATLMKVLKQSAVDREKIAAIRKFIDEGGQELHYLAEQMPQIMGMLVFQNSRRQLLAALVDTLNSAKEDGGQHKQSDLAQDDAASLRLHNLTKALDAADAECKKLEYWSDRRKLAEDGKAGNAPGPKSGWGVKWGGLDGSGPSHP